VSGALHKGLNLRLELPDGSADMCGDQSSRRTRLKIEIARSRFVLGSDDLRRDVDGQFLHGLSQATAHGGGIGGAGVAEVGDALQHADDQPV